jgi:hypothetical protein
MSGSIDVPVTRATNMPGFTAAPGTSVQPISSGWLSGPQKPAAAVRS